MLDLENTAFLGMSAPKCLWSTDLLLDCYQILHTRLFRWVVFNAVIFFRFFFIVISILDFENIAFIGMSAPKCLCSPGLLSDCYPILGMTLFTWCVLHAVIGFSNFCFFYFYSGFGL